jgi:hypothetical protein
MMNAVNLRQKLFGILSEFKDLAQKNMHTEEFGDADAAACELARAYDAIRELPLFSGASEQ